METILLFFLKKVCHILLTNSSLELISNARSSNAEAIKVYGAITL